MKALVILLILGVIVVVGVGVLLAVVLLRGGQRTYQKYSGLDRQRTAAKQSRETGADRLKTAERHLVVAQRELVGRKEFTQSQEIERLRTQVSTLVDRLRHATYGYSPIGSANPIKEAELAELQERDSEMIIDAQAISELAEQVQSAAAAGESPDLGILSSALENLRATLDRRRAVN
jgi:hypothetical protein